MPRLRLAALVAVFSLVLGIPGIGTVRAESESPRPSHVVVIGMDNYHLDDIRAHMPHLWSFLQRGALSTASHHPGLPTRTAPDFSSIAGGHYPDRHGVINNTFLAPAPRFRVGFSYWENLVRADPPTFLNAPDAPWKAFNAAGWDVGAIGFQGMVMETKAEVEAYVGRPVTAAERDRYWGLAVHRADGSTEFGSQEIAPLAGEFAGGWVNGWEGPPRKQAPITLRMTSLMQAAGVPITFTFIENMHTRCTLGATPPCQFDLAAGTFDDMLAADDAAFGRFFQDLARAGITTANTLFVITTDEGDHYLHNFAKPIAVSPAVRSLAVVGSDLLFYGSYDQGAELVTDPRTQYVASRAAMKALHISAGTDARTPTFIAFAEPDSTYQFGTAQNRYRWNHGNIHPDITDIWLGIAGPGIRRGRLEAFTDHADLVPTIRAVLGIPLGADTDGVPITTAWNSDLAEVREAFKQLNAPLGQFGMAILSISTAGAKGGPASRSAADDRIAALGAARDALVAELRQVLSGEWDGAGIGDQPASFLERARLLLAEATA